MHPLGLRRQLLQLLSLVTVSRRSRLVRGSNSGVRFSSLERDAGIAVVVAVRSLIGFTTVPVLPSKQMSRQINLPLVGSLIHVTHFCFCEKASWTIILD